eukprot:PhM_4_TR10293/c0_g1_i1/m.15707/K03850/ALG10; alpha-1,2-glucosyltransferase
MLCGSFFGFVLHVCGKHSDAVARVQVQPVHGFLGLVKRVMTSYLIPSSINNDDVLYMLLANIVPIGGFLFFVFGYNDGAIVLGDKTAHVPGLHLAQVAYLFVFIAAMYPGSALQCVLQILADVGAVKRGKTVLLMLSLVSAVALLSDGNIIAHPYLLADNRHYTFYFYRRLVQPRLIRYFVLAPAAVVGAAVVFRSWLGSSVPRLLVLAWFCATLAVVVPQRLLEFRYFLPPVMVARVISMLMCGRRTWSRWAVAVDLLWHILVNAATVLMFVKKPFPYDATSEGRLMW